MVSCLRSVPGVKTGVDHYDLQILDIYMFPSSIILLLTLGSGWLIPLGLGIDDCSRGCLMGLVLWLVPSEIGVWVHWVRSERSIHLLESSTIYLLGSATRA